MASKRPYKTPKADNQKDVDNVVEKGLPVSKTNRYCPFCGLVIRNIREYEKCPRGQCRRELNHELPPLPANWTWCTGCHISPVKDTYIWCGVCHTPTPTGKIWHDFVIQKEKEKKKMLLTLTVNLDPPPGSNNNENADE